MGNSLSENFIALADAFLRMDADDQRNIEIINKIAWASAQLNMAPGELIQREVPPLMEKVGEAMAALLGGTDAQGEVHSTLAKQALYFKARSAECLEKLECWKRWKGYNDPADWWKS